MADHFESEGQVNPKVQNIIARLALGEKVVNKEGGNSMIPLIKSKQPVTIEAVDPTKLENGDIVYCKVKGSIYTHKVVAVRADAVCIGNNRGGINGWTKHDNIYGIITEVEGTPIGGVQAKVKKKEGS